MKLMPHPPCLVKANCEGEVLRVKDMAVDRQQR